MKSSSKVLGSWPLLLGLCACASGVVSQGSNGGTGSPSATSTTGGTSPASSGGTAGAGSGASGTTGTSSSAHASTTGSSGGSSAACVVTSVTAQNSSVAFGATPPNTLQLSATVAGSSGCDLGVTWALDTVTNPCAFLGASVSAGGLFTAPTSASTFIGGQCDVVATSVADPKQSAVAVVTITAPTSSGGSSGGTAGASSAGTSGGSTGGGSSGTSGTTGSVGPGFPRLASALISTDDSAPNGGYDINYALWASKMSVNIMGANWLGAGSSLLGGSREALVASVHSQSTIGAQVFQYYNTDNEEGTWPVTNVQSWLLYQLGTSGPCVINSYFAGTTVCNTNQTLYPPADASGLHLEGEYAQSLIATFDGTSSDAAPDMDGTYHDNTILTPTVAGDYARDGVSEPVGDPDAGLWIREGLAEGFDYLQANSSLIAIANLGGWGEPTGSVGGGMDASGLAGHVQGGLIEGVFGYSWSVETWAGFAAAQTHYQFCMANTSAPRLVAVHHSNLQANGSDPTAFDSSGNPTAYGTPYQAMRYSLAFTLMDDGYYATAQNLDYYDDQRNWFDEFAVDPQTGVALAYPDVDTGLGYLGQPTDGAWPAPLASGVYERHFSNAAAGTSWLVLLNPKGNGIQTVALGQTFTKLNGTQAPTVNDGSQVQSVTLQDRDGLILMGP